MEPALAAFLLGVFTLLAVVMLEVATRSVSNLIAAVKHRRRLRNRRVR